MLTDFGELMAKLASFITGKYDYYHRADPNIGHQQDHGILQRKSSPSTSSDRVFYHRATPSNQLTLRGSRDSRGDSKNVKCTSYPQAKDGQDVETGELAYISWRQVFKTKENNTNFTQAGERAIPYHRHVDHMTI